MSWYMIILLFVVLLGAFNLSYQIYRLTELDAKCRGLKHPKFWGLFSLSGNNGGGGLLIYLIGRRKYPSAMTEDDNLKMESRKKKAGVALIFITLATIGLIISCVFTL